MRLSMLSPALALASIAAAQSSHLSDEMRQEIRALIRDEIRAALKEHAAPATTPVQTTAKTPLTVVKADGQPHTVQWVATTKPMVAGVSGAKAYRMTDGKLEEVKLQDVTDEHGSFRFVASGDSPQTYEVVTTDGRKIVQLSPTVTGGKAVTGHQIVVTKDVEGEANECCESVKVVTKKGENAAECCEAGEGAAAVIEIQAEPAKAKAKKNKKGGKKNKVKVEKGEAKVETINDPEEVKAVTELKISEVLEKLSR